jgi:hypothetical protein
VSACSRCQDPRPRANLTLVGAELLCPEDLAKVAEYQITHQKPAPPSTTSRSSTWLLEALAAAERELRA